MVVRMQSNSPISIALNIHCQLPHHTIITGDELIIDGYATYHSLPCYINQQQRFWYDSARGIHFRTIVKALNGTV